MHYRHLQLVTLAFMLLICIALLSACGTTPPPTIIYKDKYLHTEVPSEVTAKVTPTAPIETDLYLAMTPVQREVYLANYVLDLLGTVASCNNKLTTVETVIKTQKGVQSESQPQVQGNHQ